MLAVSCFFCGLRKSDDRISHVKNSTSQLILNVQRLNKTGLDFGEENFCNELNLQSWKSIKFWGKGNLYFLDRV